MTTTTSQPLQGRHDGHVEESALSKLDLSRWQFAITVMFHMTFPPLR